MDILFADLTAETREGAKDVKSNQTLFRILGVFALVG